MGNNPKSISGPSQSINDQEFKLCYGTLIEGLKVRSLDMDDDDFIIIQELMSILSKPVS